jgi:hypothetical protein
MSDYSDYVLTIANLCVLSETIDDATAAEPSDDETFNQILPQGIAYAENRMYRELDLLGTFSSTTANFTALTRNLSVPGNLIVLQGVNVITPVGQAPTGASAKRNPLQRVSIDFLNAAWPNAQTADSTGIPRFYAMPDEDTISVAPAPSATYTAEFIGTVRPTALSHNNTATLLTNYCMDAFVLCSMVFFAGPYQKNIGAQSSDPQLALSYEKLYQTAKASIDIEAARQKAMGPQWQPLSPTVVATPPRT